LGVALKWSLLLLMTRAACRIDKTTYNIGKTEEISPDDREITGD